MMLLNRIVITPIAPTLSWFIMAAFFCGALLSSGCESKVKVSIELQQLRDRYEQVQDDMKEAEVIEIFEGYKPGVGELAREVDPNCKPLKRPCTYAIMFQEKAAAGEGDHFA